MQCPYCFGEDHRPVGLVLENGKPDPIAAAVSGNFVLCRACDAMFEVPPWWRARHKAADDHFWTAVREVATTVWPEEYETV